MVDIGLLQSTLNKELGLTDPKPVPYVLPSGSRSLDRALGVGGYPGGRIVELYGPESGGKSTMAMRACISAERMGLPFAYVDMEAALDLAYFARMGLKGEANKDWLHVAPDTGEDAVTVVEKALNAGVKVVVVDSVAAMIPKAELVGDSGEAHMGLQARLMSQALRKLTGRVSRSEAIIIFINQVRMKIGVVFGNPETTTGGNALKFYASVRLSVRQVGDPIEDASGTPIGNYSKVKVIKNKVAPPKREATIPIVWGVGLASEYELFDEAIVQGIISKASSYFSYRGQRVNGKVNALAMVREHAAEIEADLASKEGIRES